MADQENRALLHADHAMGGRYVGHKFDAFDLSTADCLGSSKSGKKLIPVSLSISSTCYVFPFGHGWDRLTG